MHRQRHRVGIQVSHDPEGAGDDEKDDQHPEGEGQDIVRVIRPAAQMQKENEVNADLRQSEHDQAHRYSGGP